MHTIFLKLSFGRFSSFKFHAKKRPNDNLKKDLCVYLFLHQSLYDLTNSTVCSLKLVLVLTNALGHILISVLYLINSLGRTLISVLGHTNPLDHRLISALVLTSHLKCQIIILLILLCLAAPFLTAPGCFCLAYH